MARPTGCGGVSHSQRTLFSSFLPTAAFHYYANQDANRLSKSLTAAWMNAA
jgi:hypothetical protein